MDVIPLIFNANGYVGIGWFTEPINLQSSREEIKVVYRNIFPGDGNMTVNQNAGQIYRFINDIKIGDIVITPYSDKYLLVGKIKSEAYFENTQIS